MRGWLWLLVKNLIWLIIAGGLGLFIGWLLWGWRKKWISVSEWENHDRQLADLRAQNSKVEGEYQSLVARNGQLEAEHRNSGVRYNELEHALVAARNELEAARSDLANCNAELANARSRHADCENRINALTTQVSSLQGEAGRVQPLVIDVTDKTQRIQALEAQVAELHARMPHDDLNKIIGIGPVINGKLHEMGIHWFHQIAGWTDADVERIGAQLDFPGRIEREEWREQAREILAGTWDREKPGSVNT